jgi:putative flippase GtrA
VSRLRLVVLYALFAVLATLANLFAQWLVLLPSHGPVRQVVALTVGTLVGMPLKYVLDKRYIFQVATSGLLHDLRLFVLYGAMAVVTTVIFWGTELVVGHLTASRAGLLAGGALGLAIGYVIKYQLDKKFVFSKLRSTTASEVAA